MSSDIKSFQTFADNTLKQLERNLSFQNFSSIYQMIMQVPAGVAIFKGPEFTAEIVNDIYLNLIDRSGKELVGHSLFDAVPELKGQEAEKLLRKVLATGHPYYGKDFKTSLIRDGKKEDVFFDFVYQPLKNEEGKTSGVIVIAYEVTSAVKAKHILTERERQFRNLVMQSPVAMAIFKGEDYIIDIANETILKNIWQRQLHEVQGKKLMDVFPELKDQRFPMLLKKVYDTHARQSEKEAIVFVNNGEGEIQKYHLDFEYSPLFEPDDKTVSGVMVTVIDVTMQVNARKKIEESEYYLRRMADNMPAMLIMSRKDELFTHQNRQWYNYTGLDEKDSSGFGWLAAVHPEQRENVEKTIKDAISAGLEYTIELRLRKKDGTYRWFVTTGRQSFDANGEAEGYLATWMDIHEQKEPVRVPGVLQDIAGEKQAPLSLQQSEIRYRNLIYGLPVAFYTCDKNGKIGIYNEAAVELLGRKPDEKDRWCSSDRIFNADGSLLSADECPMAITVKTGKSVKGREIVIERRDGTRVNVLPHPEPIFDEQGNVTGGLNMLVDITERKIAERDTSRLVAIIQSSDDAIISKTMKGIVTSWNLGAEKLFGYTADEMIGQSITKLIPPDRTREGEDILTRIGRGEQIRHFDTLRVTKTGKLIDISLTISPIKDANGDVIGASKIARDITVQKRLYKTLHDNEQRLQMAVKAAELGTWEFVINTDEVAYNKRFLEIAGFAENDHPNREQMLARLYPPDLALKESVIQAAHETGMLDMEVRFVHEDKSIHWTQVRGKLFYDDEDNPERMVGTVLDVSPQKNAFEALRESELLFKTIANVAPVGLWMTDHEAKNNFVNGTWIDWTGMSLEEQYDGGWMNAVLPEDAARTRKNFIRAFVVRGNFSDEFRLKRKDGEIRWCFTEGFPFYNNKGEFEGYAGSVTDITERKMIEEQLEKKVYERTQELKQSNAELEQFAYVASHDLQEPLRKIKTFVNRLQETTYEKNEEQRKLYMEKTVAAAARMSDLIRDLLEYSRTGRVSEKHSLTDLNSVLENVKNDIELLIHQKKAIIQSGKLPVLNAVPHQMTQLFTNLLSNSLKFAKEDMPPVIRISSSALSVEKINKYELDPAKNYAEIVFSDNGIGFNNEFSERIFEIFQRLNPRSAYSGSGIGLSICRKIVNNHNGLIFAESTEGTGTSFYVILPSGHPAENTEPIMPDPVKAAADKN